MTAPAKPPCASVSVDFGGIGKGQEIALPCLPSFVIPKLLLPSLNLPDLTLIFKIPFPPKISLTLSCDLSKPLDITASLPPTGLRTPCFFADPDDQAA
jgi:hypothetical protein